MHPAAQSAADPRAFVVGPGSETLRNRRLDVSQHRTLEAGDARRLRAVEGDVEVPDRRHRPTSLPVPGLIGRSGDDGDDAALVQMGVSIRCHASGCFRRTR